MTTHSLSSYQSAIDKAFAAIQAGNRKQAIRWTNLAIAQNPKEEDPWLLMAYLASPKASIDYLKHALTLNPFSLRARKGLEWAQKRFKSQLNEEQNQNFPNQELLEITHKTAVKAVRSAPKLKTKTHKKRPPASQITTNDQKIIGGFFAAASAAFIIFIFWLTSPDIVKGGFNNSSNSSGPALVLQVTATPTNTATATPTNTPTQTPTFTPTIIPTSSPTPSPTATSTPTQIPGPTAIPIPPYSADQKWIEVDLTEQRLTAYIGNTAVRSFIVSTGTKYTPTVQGVFTVYRIYKSASMSGPGYNLPGVPNILYFFEGYSIHGTYWHNNFGTPMSHGCVNMSIEDSAWIYNFGGLGTIVYVKY